MVSSDAAGSMLGAAPRPVAGLGTALAVIDAENCASATDYATAMKLLEAGDASAALAAFESLAAQHPQDPLVTLHLARLRAGAQDDLIVMSEK